MVDYDELHKNNLKEKNRIQNEIKELEKDIFKYRSRGDFPSATHCLEKKVRLNADLSKKEEDIVRIEKIIKNEGINSDAPAAASNNSLNQPENLPIDDGTITTTMTVDVEFSGTKGDNKKIIHQTHSQTVKRQSEIRNHQVVSQISKVDTNSSKQTIRNMNLIGHRNSSTNRILRQSPNKSMDFLKNNEIHEKQQMESFISNLKRGKTWDESAGFLQISPRKALKWYRQGKNDFSKNTRFFYNQINNLEINVSGENDEVQSVKSNIGLIASDNKINERKKMHSFINHLKNGCSLDEASELSKIPSTQVSTWYRIGSNNFSENTSYFYNQLKKLNISPNLINFDFLDESDRKVQSHEIIDVNVVKEDKKIITDEDLIDDKKAKMNLIIFNLKEGKSLEKASENVGISVDIINDWILKGKIGIIDYVDFYNEYKSIEEKISLEKFKLSTGKEYSIEERIKQMDSIHNELNDVKSLMEDINENISQKDFQLQLKQLIDKFKLRKQEKENELKINSEIISGYGYISCRTIEDYKNKKIHISNALADTDDEIREAGLKNKHTLVGALQNKKVRYKTQLLEIDNIILLLSKQETLEQDISEIDSKIKDLKQKLRDIKNERKEMDGFLDAYRDAESCKDAADLVNIKVQKIVNWIHEGRDGTSDNKIYFFNEFNKIKSEKERIIRGNELRKLKKRQIKKEINESKYKTHSSFDKNQKNKMANVLSERKTGSTIVQAAKKHNVPISTVNKWYNQGKEKHSENTIYFYEEMQKIENEEEFNQMSALLAALMRYGNKKEACKVTGIPASKLDSWINQAGKGENKNAEYFVREYERLNITEDYNSGKNKKQNSKLCPQCGREVDSGQNYCNFCGYKLKATQHKKVSIFDKIRRLF